MRARVRQCVIRLVKGVRFANNASRRCVRRVLADFTKRHHETRRLVTGSRGKVGPVIRVYATGHNALLRRLSYRREIRPGENNALCAVHNFIDLAFRHWCVNFARVSRATSIAARMCFVTGEIATLFPSPLPSPSDNNFSNNRICVPLRNLIIFATSLQHFYCVDSSVKSLASFFEVKEKGKYEYFVASPSITIKRNDDKDDDSTRRFDVRRHEYSKNLSAYLIYPARSRSCHCYNSRRTG